MGRTRRRAAAAARVACELWCDGKRVYVSEQLLMRFEVVCFAKNAAAISSLTQTGTQADRQQL